jgi:hypothetical protein
LNHCFKKIFPKVVKEREGMEKGKNGRLERWKDEGEKRKLGVTIE